MKRRYPFSPSTNPAPASHGLPPRPATAAPQAQAPTAAAANPAYANYGYSTQVQQSLAAPNTAASAGAAAGVAPVAGTAAMSAHDAQQAQWHAQWQQYYAQQAAAAAAAANAAAAVPGAAPAAAAVQPYGVPQQQAYAQAAPVMPAGAAPQYAYPQQAGAPQLAYAVPPPGSPAIYTQQQQQQPQAGAVAYTRPPPQQQPRPPMPHQQQQQGGPMQKRHRPNSSLPHGPMGGHISPQQHKQPVIGPVQPGGLKGPQNLRNGGMGPGLRAPGGPMRANNVRSGPGLMNMSRNQVQPGLRGSAGMGVAKGVPGAPSGPSGTKGDKQIPKGPSGDSAASNKVPNAPKGPSAGNKAGVPPSAPSGPKTPNAPTGPGAAKSGGAARTPQANQSAMFQSRKQGTPAAAAAAAAAGSTAGSETGSVSGAAVGNVTGPTGPGGKKIMTEFHIVEMAIDAIDWKWSFLDDVSAFEEAAKKRKEEAEKEEELKKAKQEQEEAAVKEEDNSEEAHQEEVKEEEDVKEEQEDEQIDEAKKEETDEAPVEEDSKPVKQETPSGDGDVKVDKTGQAKGDKSADAIALAPKGPKGKAGSGTATGSRSGAKAQPEPEAKLEPARLRLQFGFPTPPSVPSGAPTGPSKKGKQSKAIPTTSASNEKADAGSTTAAQQGEAGSGDAEVDASMADDNQPDAASTSSSSGWTPWTKGPPQLGNNRVVITYGNGMNRLSIDVESISEVKVTKNERCIVIRVKKQVGPQATKQLQNGRTTAQEWVINRGFVVEQRDNSFGNFRMIPRPALHQAWEAKEDDASRDHSLPPLFRLLPDSLAEESASNGTAASSSASFDIVIKLDPARSLPSDSWLKTGEVENVIGQLRGFGGSASAHPWFGKLTLTDPDPPPTFEELLQGWASISNGPGSLGTPRARRQWAQEQSRSTNRLCALFTAVVTTRVRLQGRGGLTHGSANLGNKPGRLAAERFKQAREEWSDWPANDYQGLAVLAMFSLMDEDDSSVSSEQSSEEDRSTRLSKGIISILEAMPLAQLRAGLDVLWQKEYPKIEKEARQKREAAAAAETAAAKAKAKAKAEAKAEAAAQATVSQGKGKKRKASAVSADGSNDAEEEPQGEAETEAGTGEDVQMQSATDEHELQATDNAAEDDSSSQPEFRPSTPARVPKTPARPSSRNVVRESVEPQEKSDELAPSEEEEAEDDEATEEETVPREEMDEGDEAEEEERDRGVASDDEGDQAEEEQQGEKLPEETPGGEEEDEELTEEDE